MMIETNVNGPFYMTRPVVKYLLPQRRGGSIIGISTSYGTMKRLSHTGCMARSFQKPLPVNV